MSVSADKTLLANILPFREQYREEMACQIIHDSIHGRPGWTDEYVLLVSGTPVGYGSVAVAGPWRRVPALYEFYVVPEERTRLFVLFQALLDASAAPKIEVQSNDVLATTMLHTFAGSVTSEAILFQDGGSTSLQPAGARFRQPIAEEMPDVSIDALQWHGVIDVDGEVAASGGILFHYNRPYGDIYMDTRESFRGRGLGAFLVQELKRVCYAGGRVPGARCRTSNVASRRTLQRAGFVPCGHIVKGKVKRRG